MIRISLALYASYSGGVMPQDTTVPVFSAVHTFILPSRSGQTVTTPYDMAWYADENEFGFTRIAIGSYEQWNSKSLGFLRFTFAKNGSQSAINIAFDTWKSYIKIWRLKK